ncbi:MAG: PQQ-like beta-propeller repeat protein [Myxococcota bacterium]|nr:PQQ-like beta-propeller repeat protein [Myxococcota bacterium]
MRSAFLAVLVASLAGCREPTLTTPLPRLFAVPSALLVDSTYLGKPVRREVELRNSARYPLTLRFELSEGPFRLVDPPAEAVPGATRLQIEFLPTTAGPHRAQLVVVGEDQRTTVELAGEGRPHPVCESIQCHQAYFDLPTEQCADRPLPDATVCDPHNQCLTGAVCRAGRCEGQPRVCDDGNACTLDVCHAIDGCQAVPAPPCPDDLPNCKLGSCDPGLGCVLSQARDGTICDPDSVTCIAVDVCVAGTCQQRDPPDGFICAEATPCRAEGQCQGQVCVQPDAFPLIPTWSYDTTQLPPDQENELHDFVLEPSGAISLSGWFSLPIFRANRPEGRLAEASARRCILWNDRALCLDYPWPSRNGKVAMIDLATGVPRWTFDLVEARPDFAAQAVDGYLFLARIAVMGTDRFAALFEAYPRAAGAPTTCRMYFLVVLDPGGRMVHARRVDDPFLTRCDHPHPYGFSADVKGNLYLAFAPSLVGDPPLEPGPPTQILSYSRDGALRWSRGLEIRGGELAVANGVLYPEQGTQPLDATTGEPLPPGVQWGRAVATRDLVVQAPPPLGLGRGARLSAYATDDGSPRWSYALPVGESFSSYELRLSDWRPREGAQRETVVLGFSAFGELTETRFTDLVAVRARDGQEAWRCPMEFDGAQAPDLFELNEGHLALMAGSQTCGRCDPPYAGSFSTFHVFDTPGLYVPSAPWPGSFGGPAHHGQELPAYLPPVR